MLYAHRASLAVAAIAAALAGDSATGGFRAADWAPPATCAQAKDDARDDSQQPAEHGAREDDPDQGGVATAGHPTQFHLARVRDHECNQDDQQRDKTERQGVEARAVAVSTEPFPARLDRFAVRQCSLWLRFDLHRFSSRWRGGHVGFATG